MVIVLRKLLAPLALLLCAQVASASLVVNGGFEDLDIDTLPASYPHLGRGVYYGRPGNIFLGLPGGSSIPGWTTEGTRSDLINNNIGSAPIAGAYWPSAYEGEQFMYLNSWGNTSTSMYQTIGLAGGSLYSLEFFLNGLTGYGSVFDGLPYQPQVIVSILDESLASVYQMLVTGTSNTTWTEIDLNFSVLNSGNYRLVFSTPTNPVLPVGQDQNFITLDGISMVEMLLPPPPPPPQPVAVPPTLLCILAGLIGLGVTRRRYGAISSK